MAMLFMSTPQSRLAPCQLPVKGSLLVRFTSLHIKPALKGDSSRARPVGDAARGESGGIGSIASGSEARRPYSNQRSWHGEAMTKGERLKAAKLFYCSPSDNPPKLSPGWNKVVLLTFVRNSPCSCPFSVSLHPPLAALNSEPRKRWRLLVRFTSSHDNPAKRDFTWRSHISHCDSNISPVRRTDFTACVSMLRGR